MIIALLALAGGTGAVARFLLDNLIRSRLGRAFPWGTLIINISGALLLGLLTGLVLSRHPDTNIKLIMGTGFCGGYTTFSTASFESVRLFEEKRWIAGSLNMWGSLLIILIAAGLGIWLGNLA